MSGPLQGIRVVEIGVVIAGPAASAALADWGADVVKVEPVEGDPQRGNMVKAYFGLDNRGKRSIVLNLKSPGGQAVMQQLLARADVFVSNVRASALARLGLDWETLSTTYPRLVYALVSGYGTSGPAADKAGYDIGAFWSRAGIARTLMPRDGEPAVQRPGMGDHVTGLSTAAGVAAALYARERTGRGDLVTTSLVRAGTYVLASDLAAELAGHPAQLGLRRVLHNPLLGGYRSSDDRWFWLLGLQGARHWPRIARAIGRPDLVDDQRFATAAGQVAHRWDVVALLDAAFAEHPMSYWIDVFATHDVWWDPVQTPAEVVQDPLVEASGAFRAVQGTDTRTVAGPVDFASQPREPLQPAPEWGQHTEEILLELGYDWPDITTLKDTGATP